MKRKYIVAVLLLLSMGVISTLAISYNTSTLEESWGIEYTLDYADADLSLSNPQTVIVSSSSIEVTLDASHVGVASVKAKLVITALDGDSNPIDVDGTGASCQVEFKSGGSVVETDTDTVAGSGGDLTTIHEMDAASAVDQVVITWSLQDSLAGDYEAATITVTDI